MAQCLTWTVLNQADTAECLEAVDLDALRAVLKRIDDTCGGELLHPQEQTPAQIEVLLELYGHLLLYCKAAQLPPFKTSTFFGVLYNLHEASMARRLTRVESYDLLRRLVVQHSVHRPPYSTMVFSVGEVQEIDTYLLSTYYRHYKMYVYCFVPREVATLRTVMLKDITELPPMDLPPLSSALTERTWREKMQDQNRLHEEEEMERELPLSEALAAARDANGAFDGPGFNAGIRRQLEEIRDAVSKHSTGRLEVIEERLAAIEAKVVDSNASVAGRVAPSATAKKKK